MSAFRLGVTPQSGNESRCGVVEAGDITIGTGDEHGSFESGDDQTGRFTSGPREMECSLSTPLLQDP